MKKFPSVDWARPVVVVATCVVRLRHVAFGLVGLSPVLFSTVWFAGHVKAAPSTGPVQIDFRQLAFRVPPEANDPEPHGKGYNRWLPESLRAYDGRKIAIEGYMMPTRTKDGEVREFVVLPNQMTCCYGQPPSFCGFILARATKNALAIQQDQPLRFEGTLHVGDVFEQGTWMAVYTLDCTVAERNRVSGRSSWW